MRQMKTIFGILALAASAATALPAAAAQTIWTSDLATAATAPSSCNTTGVSTAVYCQMTITVGGQTLKVRAYSTTTANHNSADPWRAANLVNYTGGFGITNLVAADTGEGTPPEHAVDNNQAYDALVFELPSSGFDLDAFELGWAQLGTTANKANVQAWFGGNNLASDYDFSGACFTSGCGTTLANLGLTDITSTLNNPNAVNCCGDGGSNVPINTVINVDGVQSGKYLVVAGALADSTDYFKVNVLKATPGGPGGSAPEPGTLALLGLGLLGLAKLRGRKAAQA